MIKKCIGCGSVLQTEDESLRGYTPDLKKAYCKRCFRLKNYGEKNMEEEIDEKKLLNKVNKTRSMAFFLIDFLNINRETIALFNKIKISKVLVISKSDLLRKEMKPEKIKLWLQKTYHVKDKILLISSKPNFKSNNLLKVLMEEGKKEAYIMGITNAGKSTLLNKLMRENNLKKEILTSDKPNTTLDFIKIRIGEYTLVDTPGFPYENDDLALLKKEMKPTSLVIKPATTLIINDTRFYFEQGNKIVFYGSTRISREYNKEKEKYRYTIPKNHDIVLPGIGFLNIKEPCQILANKEDLEIRIDSSEDEV